MRLSVRGLIGVLLIAMIAACAPNAETYIISPDMGALVESELAGQAVQAIPTAVPRLLVDLTPEEVLAGLPPEVASAIPSADPGRGERLTQTVAPACIGCHSVDPAVTGLAGPNWSNVGNNAVNRIPSMGPALYLYDSIANPGSFTAPGFQPGLMPDLFKSQLSPQDYADIITYLLSHTTQ